MSTPVGGDPIGGTVARRGSWLRNPTTQRGLLVSALSLTVASWGWYLLHRFAEVPLTAAIFLPSAALGFVNVVMCTALGRDPDLPEAARLFWRRFGWATTAMAVGIGCGTVFRLVEYWRGGPGDGTPLPVRLPPWSMAPLVLLLVITTWALFAIPVRERTRADRIRLLLDGATVVSAAGAFLWYFVLDRALSAGRPADKIPAMIVMVLGLLMLTAVVKVAVAGAGPVDPQSIRALGIGGVVVAVGGFGAASFGRAGEIFDTMCIGSAAPAIAATAAYLQFTARTRASRDEAPARRPYSLLPFGALAAVDTLLLAVEVTSVDSRRRVVVCAAVLITLLLAVRQLSVLHSHERLIEEIRSQRERARHDATHDSLTGLKNRAFFNDLLDTTLPDDDPRLTLLLIDLDDFKPVNDTLGHSAGDELLRHVATVLRETVRAGEIVVRLGGDEFAVILTGAQCQSGATAMAQRLQRALGEPTVIAGHRVAVKASMGLAEARPREDAGLLFHRADLALYDAKRRQKGCYREYSSDLEEAAPAEQAPLSPSGRSSSYR